MRHLMLKTCVGGACALAFVVGYGPAKAISPLALDESPSLVVPIMDEEDLAVEEDLRPDEVPAGAEDGEMSEPMMPPEESEKESGDIEDEMLDEIGPGAE